MDSRMPYFITVVIINTVELAVLRRKIRRSYPSSCPSEYVIMSIGFADLIAGIHGTVSCMITVLWKRLPSLAIYSVFQFALTISTMNVIALTIERLLMIFAPGKHRYHFTIRKTKKLIYILWASAATVTILTVVAVHYYSESASRILITMEVLPTSIFLFIAYPMMHYRLTIVNRKVSSQDRQRNVFSEEEMQSTNGGKISDDADVVIEPSERNARGMQNEKVVDNNVGPNVPKVCVEMDADQLKEQYNSPSLPRKAISHRLIILGMAISTTFAVCHLPLMSCYLVWIRPDAGGKKCFTPAYIFRVLQCIVNPILYFFQRYFHTFLRCMKGSSTSCQCSLKNKQGGATLIREKTRVEH